MSDSPTSRSLDYLRKQGFHAGVVEQNVRYPEKINGRPTGKMIMFKRDLFGWCDIIAVRPSGKGTVYVQTTSRANQSSRLKKIIASKEAIDVLLAGNTILVHGWAQVGARGERKTWQVSVHRLELINGSMNPVLTGGTVDDDEEFDPTPSLFKKGEILI